MNPRQEQFGGVTFYDALCIARLAYINCSTKGMVYDIVSTHSKWQVLDIFEGAEYQYQFWGQKYSFRAILIQSPEIPKTKILAFSGSDKPWTDWGDWWMDNTGQAFNGTSPQYELAKRLTKRVQPNLLLGHSLGGGLASCAAIHSGINAITINPAPLNVRASGELMKSAHGKVINFVAKGEALDQLQDLSYKCWIRRDNNINLLDLREFTVFGYALGPAARAATAAGQSAQAIHEMTTKNVPYMKRVGRDYYMPSNATNFVSKHFLNGFVGYVEPKIANLSPNYWKGKL